MAEHPARRRKRIRAQKKAKSQKANGRQNGKKKKK